MSDREKRILALREYAKENFRRQVLDEPYRPVSYSLTDKGRKLASLLRELNDLS